MISARGITHRYRDRTVLSIDTFTLDRGAITALVGPNGSGKSTLLRILGFLERPTEGAVSVDGTEVDSNRARRAARRRVTLVEQQPFLFAGSLEQNVRFALRLHHDVTTSDTTDVIGRVLDELGIAELRSHQARSLSDGERQRAAIARALVLQPDVLLLDEPVSAVDRPSATQIYEALERRRDDGLTVCFCSHQLEDAYRWSDRVLALQAGRLTPVTPENLFRVELGEGTGARSMAVGPLTVHAVSDLSGRVTVALSPDDIVVSTSRLSSSARNQFPGRIIRIAEEGRGRVSLTADVGVELVARITPAAVRELELTLGSAVVLSIKATAVRVF